MLNPVTLEDEYVALIPLQSHHTDGLHAAGQFPDIWQWTTSPYCISIQSTQAWVASCLEKNLSGEQLTFVIMDKIQNKIVGSTSYLHIFLEHKAIEIGFTFLTTSAQRTHINRRCKWLLLNHAFETLALNRVAFQTHEKNTASRNAILGLGAKFEGIQRNCRIQHDGTIRSSAFYSIIKPEWPAVNAALKQKFTTPLTPEPL
jgi:RimJ/RimL family protein N-acetyltransferase